MNKFSYESQTNVQTNMQTYSHMVWRVYAYTNIQTSEPAPAPEFAIIPKRHNWMKK